MLSLPGLRLLPASGRRKDISPLGLEFADEQLNLVQLEMGQPPVVRAYASVPYPLERAELMSSEAAVQSFLKRALGSARFSGRRVVTALPPSYVRILTVTYQLKANEGDDAAIAKLMEERIGEDISQFVIDYVPVRGETAGERLAMVLISERNRVLAYLELLRKAGLEVEALEVTPVAIRRLISTLIGAGQAPQNTLVVNTGKRKTYLSMISGKRLLFDQEIDFGESALLEQFALALDTSAETARAIVFRQGLHPEPQRRAGHRAFDSTSRMKALLTIARPHFANLVGEMHRTVMFASSETRGGTVEHAYLMGTLARWPGADALLSSLASIPVTIPRPLALAPELGDENPDTPRPDLVIAAGLALRGLPERA